MPQSTSQDTKINRHTSTPTAGIPVTVQGVSTLRFMPDRERLGRSPVPVDSPLFFALNDRIAVYQAAKAIHKSPAYIMEFVNAGLLKAYRRGGSAKRPWLAVNLSELLAVIDQETLYVPPAMVGRRRPRPRRMDRTPLHPLAAAM